MAVEDDSRTRNERLRFGTDSDVRVACIEKLDRIAADLLPAMREQLARLPVSGDDWTTFAAIIDKLEAALMGADPRRVIRMLLLESIDAAVRYADEGPRRLALAKTAANHSATNEERKAARLSLSRYQPAKYFREEGGDPASDPFGLVRFDFAHRAPDYAAAIMAAQVQQHLKAAIEVWKKSSGRPKKGAVASAKKWAAARELLESIGLGGLPEKSLEAEWRAHKRKRGRDVIP